MKSYYFQNPQLYKMPERYTTRGPDLSPSIYAPPIGAYKEDSLTKALPFIAGGIALVVLYNVFKRKK